jgi:outer membrane lipopolysaccharide assembly protein LptE/RlpB
MAAALALTVIAAAGWHLRDLLAQDACLDAGCAWRDGACRR